MSQKAEKNRLYKVLEIQPEATETEIKKAYRKLAMVRFFQSHFHYPLSPPPPSFLYLFSLISRKESGTILTGSCMRRNITQVY